MRNPHGARLEPSRPCCNCYDVLSGTRLEPTPRTKCCKIQGAQAEPSWRPTKDADDAAQHIKNTAKSQESLRCAARCLVGTPSTHTKSCKIQGAHAEPWSPTKHAVNATTTRNPQPTCCKYSDYLSAPNSSPLRARNAAKYKEPRRSPAGDQLKMLTMLLNT